MKDMKHGGEITEEAVLRAHSHAQGVLEGRRKVDAAIAQAEQEVSDAHEAAAKCLRAIGDAEAAAAVGGETADTAKLHERLDKAARAVAVAQAKVASLERLRDEKKYMLAPARQSLLAALDLWWQRESTAFASKAQGELQELQIYLRCQLPRIEAKDIRQDAFPAAVPYLETAHALAACETGDSQRVRLEELNQRASAEFKGWRGRKLKVEVNEFQDFWGTRHPRNSVIVAGKHVPLRDVQHLVSAMSGYQLSPL